MKTALYQNKFKKTLNDNCSTHFHLQLSRSVYNTRKSCKQFMWQSLANFFWRLKLAYIGGKKFNEMYRVYRCICKEGRKK